MEKNPEVDDYLATGCGRCALGGTPECRVHLWSKELILLRDIVMSCGLTETRKWGVPCYTVEGKNAVMIGAFKDCCTLSFMKGALIPDPKGLLTKPGENTQAARVIRFTDADTIVKLQPSLRKLILEAVQVEKEGKTYAFAEAPEALPEELQEMLDEDEDLRNAFYKLTPGRQRGYIIFISGAKQSATRISRILKNRDKILAGKGMMD